MIRLEVSKEEIAATLGELARYEVSEGLRGALNLSVRQPESWADDHPPSLQEAWKRAVFMQCYGQIRKLLKKSDAIAKNDQGGPVVGDALGLIQNAADKISKLFHEELSALCAVIAGKAVEEILGSHEAEEVQRQGSRWERFL